MLSERSGRKAVSGFEDYRGELADIDREIHHYAAVCGIDLGNADALQRCLRDQNTQWSEDKARSSLRGLLALRLKVEIEMLEQGFQPPELAAGIRLHDEPRVAEDSPDSQIG